MSLSEALDRIHDLESLLVVVDATEELIEERRRAILRTYFDNGIPVGLIDRRKPKGTRSKKKEEVIHCTGKIITWEQNPKTKKAAPGKVAVQLTAPVSHAQKVILADMGLVKAAFETDEDTTELTGLVPEWSD